MAILQAKPTELFSISKEFVIVEMSIASVLGKERVGQRASFTIEWVSIAVCTFGEFYIYINFGVARLLKAKRRDVTPYLSNIKQDVMSPFCVVIVTNRVNIMWLCWFLITWLSAYFSLAYVIL